MKTKEGTETFGGAAVETACSNGLSERLRVSGGPWMKRGPRAHLGRTFQKEVAH